MEDLLIIENFGNQIADVIELKTKKDVYFDELDNVEQFIVLQYIKKKNLPVKAFGKRWYNILDKTFYIEEFVLDDNYFGGIHRDIKSFSSFDDFCDYSKKDIYQESCYYGYNFTEDEILKYKLRIKELSTKAFTQLRIDSDNYESLLALKETDWLKAIENGKKMSVFIGNCKINSYKDIYKKKIQFISKFDGPEADLLFFTMLMDIHGKEVEKDIIDYVCNLDVGYGLYFRDVLVRYGVEAAQKIIDNFKGQVSYSTARRRIRGFKDELNSFTRSQLTKRKGAFLSRLGLYCVEEQYCSDDGKFVFHTEHFTSSLDEFKELLSRDLRGAKLSRAPITSEDINDCKVDETTSLPKKQIFSKYEIIKGFRNKSFFVLQKWYDNNNELIIGHEKEFVNFFDFAYYLNYNLDGADLLMCDGIENLKQTDGLDLSKAAIRSEVRELLGLSIKPIKKNLYKVKEFNDAVRFELMTVNTQTEVRQDDYSDVRTISYISDLHLLHRFQANKCKTEDDLSYTIRKIAKTINDESGMFCLIGGDTSGDFNVFCTFIKELKKEGAGKHYFFVLGNHEIWPFEEKKLDEIVEIYKNEIDDGHFHLLQNDLVFLKDGEFQKIPGNQLLTISSSELRKLTRDSKLIILGGIGFSGKNMEFNANNGIYLKALKRNEEIEESKKFYEIYTKVVEALYDRKVIVLTHMPMIDWADNNQTVDGFIYVSGHNHRNYYFDDNIKRIYADNQIGYRGKNVSLKKIIIDYSYDWFSDYEDGIYEIAKDDYVSFYRGIGEYVSLNRDYSRLFMIKREHNYMFLMESTNGKLQILNGGAIKSACGHATDYFYENLVSYSKSVGLYLSKYNRFQKDVSNAIKSFGGYGSIHGSIVDIDYMNHLYLNPLDGTITPYFATSIINKHVYNSLGSLLKYRCPELYSNYEKLLATHTNEKNVLVMSDKQVPLSDKSKAVYETDMYKVSRVLKGLQFTTKYNVIRLWSDAFVTDISEDSGKLIVKSIIDPTMAPVVEKAKQIKKPISPSEKKIVKDKKENDTVSETRYKSLINKKTGGNIEVICYLGSKAKAEYRCNACGHTWLIRPDHFKDRQNYKCPNCGK